MKQICFLIVLASSSVLAQVGIGTETPNATLEIKSTNEATPSSNDGLLIPKVEEFPATNPGAGQDGMLVYATGAGSVSKGFYFWDNGTTAWVLATGAKQIDDLSDGLTDGTGSSIFLGINAGLNDDGTTNRNVGVGYLSMSNNTTGFVNAAFGHESLFDNIDGNSNTAIGYRSLFRNTSGSGNTGIGHYALHDNLTGIFNSAVGDQSLFGNQSGNYNTASGYFSLHVMDAGNGNTSSGYRSGYHINGGNNNVFVGSESAGAVGPRSLSGSIFVGHRSGYNETNNNRLYIENSDADADNALIYGEFDNDILRTNGTLQIGNPSGTGYALPSVDGTPNQVLQTDGAGSMAWVDPSATVIHDINDLVDGKSDNDGTDDGSSIFLGVDAGLNDDATNNGNVGIGYKAMQINTTGTYNTTYGYQALFSNISGNWNVANGASSLFSNTTGGGNTANGGTALYSNTIGIQNTANGFRALHNNTSGNNNTATGKNALTDNSTGSNNTAIGAEALWASSGGNNNVALGYQSLYFNATGSNNVAIGYDAGYNETGSNKLYIENSNSASPLIYGEFDNDILGINGSLGVGTQAPEVPFHVKEDGVSGVQTIVAAIDSDISNRPVLQFSESSSISLGAGMSLEYDGRGSGDANRMVFNGVGGSPLFEFRNGGDLTLRDGDLIIRGTGTDREIKLDDDAGNPDRALMRQTGTQDIYVGDIDNNGGDTYIRAGGSTELSIISGTGFVGINTLTPGWELEVNGNAAKPGGGSWINASDRRLKKNINRYHDGLEQLLQIEPVTYQYNSVSGFDESKEYVGVIAQDLQKVTPYMVQKYDHNGNEYLAVDNSAMMYMLVNAVKEQQQTIEALKEEVQQLKNLVNTSQNE